MDINSFPDLFKIADEKLKTHEFFPLDNFGYNGVVYKCKKCGYKIRMKFNRLDSYGLSYLRDIYNILSCDEFIIKNIIE